VRVGSSLTAADWIMHGARRRAFVPIAGLHHAAPRPRRRILRIQRLRRGGRTSAARLRLSRIAYVDVDAHHGDGVYYAFDDDPELIFADLHESGHTLYPGTGSDAEIGRERPPAQAQCAA